jgi:hypothetical protein
MGFRLFTLGEIGAAEANNYLIKGVINAGECSTLNGEPGSGKTLLAMDSDYYVAAGKPWYGLRTRRAGVLYLACEGSIVNRLLALRQTYNPPIDLPFAIVQTGVDLCHSDGDTREIIRLAGEAGSRFGIPIELIDVDTVSRALNGGNENAPDDMGAFVANVDRIRAATGAHVRAIHHTGKDASKGARGHSLLRAAVDTEIMVDRDPVTKIATARVTKQRNGECAGEFSFEVEVVDLGTDADNDPITSCVIRPVEPPTKAKPESVKLSPSCSLHLAALRLALSESGQPVPASRYVPDHTIGVPIDLWRKYAYDRAISGGEQNAKRMAFRRASEQLQARQIVASWQDWVWIP